MAGANTHVELAQRWLFCRQQRSRVLLHRNARRDVELFGSAPAPGLRCRCSGLVMGLWLISTRGVPSTGVKSKAGSLRRARGSSASRARCAKRSAARNRSSPAEASADAHLRQREAVVQRAREQLAVPKELRHSRARSRLERSRAQSVTNMARCSRTHRTSTVVGGYALPVRSVTKMCGRATLEHRSCAVLSFSQRARRSRAVPHARRA